MKYLLSKYKLNALKIHHDSEIITEILDIFTDSRCIFWQIIRPAGTQNFFNKKSSPLHQKFNTIYI